MKTYVKVVSLWLALVFTGSCGGKENLEREANLASETSIAGEAAMEGDAGSASGSLTSTEPVSDATADKKAQKTQIVNASVPLEKLFHAWVSDLNDPHATFDLTKDGLFVVDYDGDGNMPYLLKGDSLIVYYDYGTERSRIKKLTNDSLVLSMNGYEVAYVRWRN
ncbi:hypothetical protein [Rufibacter roseus]|uniref:Lipocalin-like domain-containing protein n=1 Tax=Rufibacter roseus TaxID=1567108 RepID=A0ABW2DLI5_9BACT|nr:hypothetical protein [Rufibacter roseus]